MNANKVIIGKKGQWKGSLVQLKNGEITVTHPGGKTASCMVFPYFDAPQAQLADENPEARPTPRVNPGTSLTRENLIASLRQPTAPLDEEITGDTELPDRAIPPWEQVNDVQPPSEPKPSTRYAGGRKISDSQRDQRGLGLGAPQGDPLQDSALKVEDIGGIGGITEEVLDEGTPPSTSDTPTKPPKEMASEKKEDAPPSPEQAIQAVFNEMIDEFYDMGAPTIREDYSPTIAIIPDGKGNISGFKVMVTPAKRLKGTPVEAIITLKGTPIVLPASGLFNRNLFKDFSTHYFIVNDHNFNAKAEKKFVEKNADVANVTNRRLKIAFHQTLEALMAKAAPPPAQAQ